MAYIYLDRWPLTAQVFPLIISLKEHLHDDIIYLNVSKLYPFSTQIVDFRVIESRDLSLHGVTCVEVKKHSTLFLIALKSFINRDRLVIGYADEFVDLYLVLLFMFTSVSRVLTSNSHCGVEKSVRINYLKLFKSLASSLKPNSIISVISFFLHKSIRYFQRCQTIEINLRAVPSLLTSSDSSLPQSFQFEKTIFFLLSRFPSIESEWSKLSNQPFSPLAYFLEIKSVIHELILSHNVVLVFHPKTLISSQFYIELSSLVPTSYLGFNPDSLYDFPNPICITHISSAVHLVNHSTKCYQWTPSCFKDDLQLMETFLSFASSISLKQLTTRELFYV